VSDRGIYMISVAAELVGMHPQTLRIYETKGLVRPKRTPGGTRLYSEADVERLRIIQRLTTELGLNLAGVELVLRLEDELSRQLLVEEREHEVLGIQLRVAHAARQLLRGCDRFLGLDRELVEVHQRRSGSISS